MATPLPQHSQFWLLQSRLPWAQRHGVEGEVVGCRSSVLIPLLSRRVSPPREVSTSATDPPVTSRLQPVLPPVSSSPAHPCIPACTDLHWIPGLPVGAFNIQAQPPFLILFFTFVRDKSNTSSGCLFPPGPKLCHPPSHLRTGPSTSCCSLETPHPADPLQTTQQGCSLCP